MKKFLGLFGLIAIAALAPSAHANFAISVNGTTCASGAGSPTTPVVGEVGNCPAVTANSVTILNLSTQGTQTATNSKQFTTTLSLTNSSATTETVTIDAATNDFTSPNAPPPISDAFSFSLTGATGVTSATYQACVDPLNGLTAPTGTCGSVLSIGTTGSVSSASATGQIIITSLGPAAFGLNQQIVLTLAGDTTVTVQAAQTLTQVPEPGSIVLLGGALVGLATLFRKKLARQA